MRIGGFLFCFCAILVFGFSQTDDLLDSGSLDSLFDYPGESENEEGDTAKETGSENTVLEDLLDVKSLTLKGDFTIIGGYSPGWDDSSLSGGSFRGSPILELTSRLILDFNLSRDFRVYQKWTLESPDFILDPTEIFADYHPAENLSFRLGRFSETWGESRNFAFSHLLNRVPDGFSGSTDILAAKVEIPWKTGYMEMIALTREGFWEDGSPSLEDFGWGFRLNPPLEKMDLTLSLFAHPDMHLRSVLSMKTTLFDSLETYGEFLTALDTDNLDVADDTDNPVDFSLNLGIYKDFFKNRLALGAEYFYNGEESEMGLASGSWELYHGHNGAAYARWKGNGWDLTAYGRYNLYEKSGIIGPALNWHFSDEGVIQFGGAWTWGEGAYGQANPDELDRAALVFLRLKVTGSWETTL